eukprot:gene8817-6348_t
MMRLQEHSLYPVSVYKEVMGKTSSCSFIYTRMMTVPDGVFNFTLRGVYPSITDPDALCMLVCDYNCEATKLYETEAIEEEEDGETDQHQNDLELAVASLNHMAQYKQQNEMPVDNGLFEESSGRRVDCLNSFGEHMDDEDVEGDTPCDSSVEDELAASTLLDLSHHAAVVAELNGIGEESDTSLSQTNRPVLSPGVRVGGDAAFLGAHLSDQRDSSISPSLSESSLLSSQTRSLPRRFGQFKGSYDGLSATTTVASMSVDDVPPSIAFNDHLHHSHSSSSNSLQGIPRPQHISIPPVPPPTSTASAPSTLTMNSVDTPTSQSSQSTTTGSESSSTQAIFSSSPISYHALTSTSTSISSTGPGALSNQSITKTVFKQKKVRLVDRIPIFVAKPGAMFRLGDRYSNGGIQFRLSAKVEFYINKEEKVYKVRYLMNS